MRPAATGLLRGSTSLRWYFAGLGATAAVIPAVLPAFASALAVPIQTLLPAVPALFLGLLFGVAAAPLLATRVALTTVLRCGAAAQATGLTLGTCAPSPAWFVGAAAIAGAGFGAVESAGTAVIRIRDDAGTPRRLTLLTIVVGAVATVTPLVVLLLDGAGLSKLAPVTAAGVHLIAMGVSRGETMTPRSQPDSPQQRRPGELFAAVRPVALLAGALFFYVGAESVLSGWSAATITETLGTTPAVAALGTSAFWLLITAGRLLGSALNRRLQPGTAVQLLCLIAGSALGLAATVGDGSTLAVLCLLGVAVLACGPCYALILGLAVTATPKPAAIAASSALVAVGAAGGAVIPFLTITVLGAHGAVVSAGLSMGAAFALLAIGRLRRGDR